MSRAKPQHIVESDGVTVWVNGPTSLLGRFGRLGIDIHQPLDEQKTKGECLFCTHGPTTKEDWDLFVVKMKEYFGIRVPRHVMPTRFRS